MQKGSKHDFKLCEVSVGDVVLECIEVGCDGGYQGGF
jgi:hypothetical protein